MFSLEFHTSNAYKTIHTFHSHIAMMNKPILHWATCLVTCLFSPPGGAVQKSRVAPVPLHCHIFSHNSSSIHRRWGLETGAGFGPGSHGGGCIHGFGEHCGARNGGDETAPGGTGKAWWGWELVRLDVMMWIWDWNWLIPSHQLIESCGARGLILIALQCTVGEPRGFRL